VTVYLISGQAADRRLFENIPFPASVTVKHLQWIEPLKRETLQQYCRRLSEQVNNRENCILIGVSLGGIVAVELNQIINPIFIILISSVSNKRELPPQIKFCRLLHLQRLVPAPLFKWHNPLVNWIFGAKTTGEKKLLRFYFRRVTANYMKWATDVIVNWKNTSRPGNLFHIQGTADRIFPHSYTKADALISGGTHFMVHNRADEISKLISEQIMLVQKNL